MDAVGGSDTAGTTEAITAATDMTDWHTMHIQGPSSDTKTRGWNDEGCGPLTRPAPSCDVCGDERRVSRIA